MLTTAPSRTARADAEPPPGAIGNARAVASTPSVLSEWTLALCNSLPSKRNTHP